MSQSVTVTVKHAGSSSLRVRLAGLDSALSDTAQRAALVGRIEYGLLTTGLIATAGQRHNDGLTAPYTADNGDVHLGQVRDRVLAICTGSGVEAH